MTWKRGEMCESCAGRKGTDANGTPETMEALAECIASGEPFYCHESTAMRDDEGTAVDRYGFRYRYLPFARWRLCRAWTNARITDDEEVGNDDGRDAEGARHA